MWKILLVCSKGDHLSREIKIACAKFLTFRHPKKSIKITKVVKLFYFLFTKDGPTFWRNFWQKFYILSHGFKIFTESRWEGSFWSVKWAFLKRRRGNVSRQPLNFEGDHQTKGIRFILAKKTQQTDNKTFTRRFLMRFFLDHIIRYVPHLAK